MNRKIILTALIMIVCISSASAKDIYSRTMRSDGAYINKCIYDDGKIDYCSEYDSKIALELLNNPNKYTIVEEVFYQKQPENFNDKCHKAQTKMSGVVNTLNGIADATRSICGFIGVGW